MALWSRFFYIVGWLQWSRVYYTLSSDGQLPLLDFYVYQSHLFTSGAGFLVAALCSSSARHCPGCASARLCPLLGHLRLLFVTLSYSREFSYP